MIKKILTGVCTLLILGSSFPAPTIFAETVDPLTDTEATMPTITDEPTVAAQSIINKDVPADTPTTEAGSSSSSESKAQGTTNTTSSTNKDANEATTKTTSDSDKEVADSDVEAQSDSEVDELASDNISDALRAKAAKVHGIEPAAVNDKTLMVEGTFGEDDPETYMLDDTLSNALRISGINVGTGGGPWTGDQKDPGTLTIGDMKSLEVAIIRNGGGVENSPKVRDLTGLEYAFNLMDLNCAQNDLVSLDLTKNPNLTLLLCDRNQISDISLYDQGSQVNMLQCFGNKIRDFTGIIKATGISAYEQEVTIPLSDVKVEAEKQQKSIDSIIISPTIPLTKATYVSNDGLESIEGTIEGNSIKFKNMSKQKLSKGSINYESDGDYNGSDGFTMMECVLTFEDYNPQLLSEGDNSLEYSIDKNLSTALRAKSGWDGYRKNAGELTVDDMVTLTKATVSYGNLQSIKGLEFATNLTELNCSNNQLTSLEQLKGLPLVDLNCSNNKLTSIEPLKGAPLVRLDCGSNQLTSIEAIKDSPIEKLSMNRNDVSDVSCLFTSKTLKDLNGTSNGIQDISGFSGLNTLTMNNQSIEVPYEIWSENIKDNNLDISPFKTAGSEKRVDTVEATLSNPVAGASIAHKGDQLTFSGYGRSILSGMMVRISYISDELTGADRVSFQEGTITLESNPSTYLVEGLKGETDALYHEFAKILREDKAATNDGSAWSGYEKLKDDLTVADMENLTSIDVSGKELTSLWGIKYATNLKKLIADNNQLDTLEELIDLTTLEEISVNDNQLTNLDGLTDMTTLEEISVDDNQITDLYVLGSNLSMKRISAKNNKIRDFTAVEGFRALEKADLQGQKWQENSYPYFLANVVNNNLVDYSTVFPLFGSMPHTMFTFSVERADKSKDPDAICTIYNNYVGVQINAPRRSILNNGSTLHFELDPDSLEADITYTGNVSFPEYTGTVLRETEDEPSYSETIDPKFAQLLRENSDLTNGGEAWSGDDKQENRLTDLDMEALTSVDVSDSDLTSLKGIEFAMFLKNLKANNNDIEEVDFIGNKELETLELNHNSLTTLDLKNQIKLTSLDCG
ncbi:leucine-rich repeat domain-containing protein [Enterococcus alishanensis]